MYTFFTYLVRENIFNTKSKELDAEQKKDLLRVSTEGENRMISYIRQYVLDPPVEIPVNRVRRKMKTFTNQQQSVRTQKSKLSDFEKLPETSENVCSNLGYIMITS